MITDLPDICLSLNPSYFCSERCSFCYLKEEQLSDKSILDLDRLAGLLFEISCYYNIVHVDLYGGEPTLLPKPYVMSLKSLLQSHGLPYVNVNTNLVSTPNWLLEDEYFYPSISYDFSARDKSDKVWSNLMKLERGFSILSLASPEFLKLEPEYIVGMLSILKRLEAWEIKPYSANQNNAYTLPSKSYERFVERCIPLCIESGIKMTNIDMLEMVKYRFRRAFSDNHLYITPSGELAVLDFDLNDKEYFRVMRSISEYRNWCSEEISRVYNNKACGDCAYVGGCLSEHYRRVEDKETGCSGHFNLIEWYLKAYPV